MLINIILTLFISLSSFPTEEDLEQIYYVIKHVETNNNPNAIGDNGRAYGVVQIHKICVLDVNRTYKTKFKHEDVFKVSNSKKIFKLYLTKGIKLYRKKYNKNPTEKDIVRMWNGGIYKGYRYKSTLKYYRKYLYYKKLYRNIKVIK